MSTYRMMLRDGTCTFHKILHGRRWVGRVYQHANGQWSAMINRTELSRCRTAAEAFDEGVAKHLGYASAGQLRLRNTVVRRAKAVRRQRADAVLASFLRAPVSQQMGILDKIEDVGQLTDVLDAFTRSLRKSR